MTPSSSSRRQNRGFTLIEILIAVAAFAIVLAAMNSVFAAALRLRNKATQSFEDVLPVENSLSVIKRDLSNLVLPGGTLFGSLQTTPSSTVPMNSSSPASTANVVPGQVSPSFFTSGGIIDDSSPFAEIQKVSYLLTSPTNGIRGRDLVRAVTRNLLSAGQEQTGFQPLLQGVEALNFFYYDGTQWRDSWDSTVADLKTGLTNILPQAIKVQMVLASVQTARSPSVELVIPIILQAPSNTVGQTTGAAP